MSIVHFKTGGVRGIAIDAGFWLAWPHGGFPGTLPQIIAEGVDLLRIDRSLEQSPEMDLSVVRPGHMVDITASVTSRALVATLG